MFLHQVLKLRGERVIVPCRYIVGDDLHELEIGIAFQGIVHRGDRQSAKPFQGQRVGQKRNLLDEQSQRLVIGIGLGAGLDGGHGVVVPGQADLAIRQISPDGRGLGIGGERGFIIPGRVGQIAEFLGVIAVQGFLQTRRQFHFVELGQRLVRLVRHARLRVDRCGELNDGYRRPCQKCRGDLPGLIEMALLAIEDAEEQFG